MQSCFIKAKKTKTQKRILAFALSLCFAFAVIFLQAYVSVNSAHDHEHNHASGAGGGCTDDHIGFCNSCSTCIVIIKAGDFLRLLTAFALYSLLAASGFLVALTISETVSAKNIRFSLTSLKIRLNN